MKRIMLAAVMMTFSLAVFADNASGTGEPTIIQALLDWLGWF